MIKKLCRFIFLLTVLLVIIVICANINGNAISVSNKNARSIKEKNKIKTAYLTFDDGPSKNTPKVLKILKEHDIRATFFVITSLITEDYEKLIKDMDKEGHAIGIHTDSHKYNSIYSSCDSYLDDFNIAEERLEKILDKSLSFYRFPGGSCNCFIGNNKQNIIEKLKKRGYKYYDWNVSAEDSVGRPTVESIKKNVITDFNAFDNAIILMHDSTINDSTVEALPEIIKRIKEEGYIFDVLK